MELKGLLFVRGEGMKRNALKEGYAEALSNEVRRAAGNGKLGVTFIDNEDDYNMLTYLFYQTLPILGIDLELGFFPWEGDEEVTLEKVKNSDFFFIMTDQWKTVADLFLPGYEDVLNILTIKDEGLVFTDYERD